jgi:hypothetical protein
LNPSIAPSGEVIAAAMRDRQKLVIWIYRWGARDPDGIRKVKKSLKIRLFFAFAR